MQENEKAEEKPTQKGNGGRKKGRNETTQHPIKNR